MQNFHKDWQVETQGQIYEAEFEELLQWIAEGAVLPTDRVRRGNLRWLPAEKVPELYNFFNSNSVSAVLSAPSVVITTSNFVPGGEQSLDQPAFPFESPGEAEVWFDGAARVCYRHEDWEAAFACDICKKFFCRNCPNSYGGVKLCPLCGGLSRPADEAVDVHKSIGAIYKPYSRLAEEAADSRKSKAAGTEVPIYRDPVILIMIAVLFSSILGAAFFLFYTAK